MTNGPYVSDLASSARADGGGHVLMAGAWAGAGGHVLSWRRMHMENDKCPEKKKGTKYDKWTLRVRFLIPY